MMPEECPKCGERFSTEHDMKIHYGHLHDGSLRGVETVCEHCSTSFRTTKNNYKSREMDFCSRNCYGKWLSKNRKGENHPNYSGGYDYPYNGSWNRVRELAIKRDYEKCRMCRLTRKECQKQYDRNLHVHHKIPTSYFDDVEEAHVLHNLITLCPDCHDYVEYE